MRFEHDGMVLWYGTLDAPAPSDTVPIVAGAVQAVATVTVGVQPPSASNLVSLRYSVNGGPPQTIAAEFLSHDVHQKAQYFAARLWTLQAGDHIDYVPICRAPGRQVPSPEEASRFVSSFKVMDGRPQDFHRMAMPIRAEAGVSPAAAARSGADLVAAAMTAATIADNGPQAAPVVRSRIAPSSRTSALYVPVLPISGTGARPTSSVSDASLPPPPRPALPPVRGTFGNVPRISDTSLLEPLAPRPAPPDVGASGSAVDVDIDIFDVEPTSYLKALGEFGTQPFNSDGSGRVATNASPPYQNLTLDAIDKKFYQRINDLLDPKNSANANETVHQIRVCIEVLRGYLKDSPLPQGSLLDRTLATAEAAYRQAAYFSLLEQIGTSYDEICLARTYDRNDPRDRKKLQVICDLLGIELGSRLRLVPAAVPTPLNPGPPISAVLKDDHLDQLFVDPGPTGSLTEQFLEEMFGLVDTTRDPFSQGATIGDNQNWIKRWNLAGVEWNRGTDSDGIVYVSIDKVTQPLIRYTVTLFSDSHRTKSLATGLIDATGFALLEAVGNSGVSGWITFGYPLSAIPSSVVFPYRLAFSVFPRFLSWQFQRVRSTWLKEDLPDDTVLSFQLTATDNSGVQATATVNVNVSHIDRPTLSASPNQSASPGATVSLTGQATASTSSGVGLARSVYHPIASYQWSQIGGLPTVTLNGAQAATATFIAPSVAAETVLRFQLTVADNSGATATATVSVTVSTNNTPLTLNPGPSQSVIEGTAVTLAGSASDSNPGATITYHWTQIGGPPVALANADKASASFTAPSGAPPPIVDPDLLINGDFKRQDQPPFTDLYQGRATQIRQWLTRLQTEPQSAVGLDGILTSTLGAGHQFAYLKSLDTQRQSGQDITPQLEAMRLAESGLEYIVRVGTLLNAGESLLDSEWSGLHSILVQVQKRQSFPSWRAIELQEHISLTPDYFNYPPAVPDVFASGVDRSGTPISDGAQDAHWAIGRLPSGSVNPPTQAYATISANKNSPIGKSWMRNTKLSRWISPQPDESRGDAPGLYAYETTIDLTGYDPASIKLTARVAVANELLDVNLNGFDIGLTASGSTGFATLSINGPFQAGSNQLVLLVKNTGTGSDPSGLRVELSFTTPPALAGLPAWRATLEGRQTWQATLTGRIGQNASLIESLRAAREATEEYTLVLLRDALVLASTAVGVVGGVNTLVMVTSDWLTQRLLIDVQADSSEKTTRLNQATEMMQGLFFALRNREFQQLSPLPDISSWTLTESLVTFDEEWTWMGTYSSWRSITLVFLYPENTLLPNLRLDAQARVVASGATTSEPISTSEKTQAFKNLVLRLSSYGQLTPTQALQEAETYRRDLGDITQYNLPPIELWVPDYPLVPDHFSTGLDLNGSNLPDHAVDPHWTLHPVINQVPVDAGAALYASGYYFGNSKLPDDAYSRWISSRPDDSKNKLVGSNNSLMDVGDPFGVYAFRCLLDLTGYDPVQVQLQVQILAYPGVTDIQLNGISLGFDLTAASGDLNDKFLTLVLPSPPAVGAPSGVNFQPRVNRLDVFVTNVLVNATVAHLQCGLRLQFSFNSLVTPKDKFRYIDPRSVDPAEQQKNTSKWFSSYPGDQTKYAYLWEALYFVPMQIALSLQKAGEFEAALDWFRTIYAYDLPITETNGVRSDLGRKAFYGLAMEGSQSLYRQFAAWMADENWSNPHLIALSRAFPYTRFTALSIVKCLLDFADSQFAAETAESIPAATTLYDQAQKLLSEMREVTGFDFVSDSNPLLVTLRRRAQTGLAKLGTGRNIAGLLGPFPASDAGIVSIQPTQYRYAALIERAKQLAGLGQQVESSFLAALEKKDAETYSLMKARADLNIAGHNVKLAADKSQEATDGWLLATDQKNRTDAQVQHYQDLLDKNLIDYEQQTLDDQANAYGANKTAGAANTIMGTASGAMEGAQIGAACGPYGAGIGALVGGVVGFIGASSAAQSSSAIMQAQISSTKASFERRQEEWQFQHDLARKDQLIADAQITIANDNLNIAADEATIAKDQQDLAQQTADFLATKFTNADLYSFMSDTLQGVYGFFLQQATAMARLAQTQLSFERQDRRLSVIQGNYWQADRRGLTGAERFLEDVSQLDQYAFLTDQRKLQLTKTFSLAQMAPLELQQFRNSGVLRFATPTLLFDSDFPGDYLRLIKRVRISVVALVPPTVGIRATLANHGISRVVTQDDSGAFNTSIVRRDPQIIGLTSPMNATGLFDLTDTQPNLLLPFEGLGVDTSWEFLMPRAANPIDFNSVADILLTIDYTALNSSDYRKQIVQQLDRSMSADRAYSFRQQFADAWYELNNPNQSSTPLVVQFKTEAQDFPPNIADLTIQQLVMYFVPASGSDLPVQPTAKLTYLGTDPDGNPESLAGTETAIENIISTRRTDNPTGWSQMFEMQVSGSWTLDLSDANTSRLFQNCQLQDILFVITYNGRLPAWPM